MANAANRGMPFVSQLAAMVGGGRDSAAPLSWLGESQQIENMLFDRTQFLASLRSAQSWDEVRSLLGAKDYFLVELEGTIFAVSAERGHMLDLEDCGHNATVFKERLGPIND